jgi:hypothetical protein
VNNSIIEITHEIDVDPAIPATDTLGQRRHSPSSITEPVRPIEFTLWVAFPFVSLFVVLATLLGVLFAKAHFNGTICFEGSGLLAIQLVLACTLLTRYRSANTFPEHRRTEHCRELHPNCHSYTDRTDVDPDQPAALHAATTGRATRLQG